MMGRKYQDVVVVVAHTDSCGLYGVGNYIPSLLCPRLISLQLFEYQIPTNCLFLCNWTGEYLESFPLQFLR